MLNDHYLLLGLNALSRAHELNYFVDGHRGGAIISGVYLCRENDVDAGVSEKIAVIIDAHWTHSDLSAPFPDESPNPQLLDRIVDCMTAHIEGLREAGHNVISPPWRLKSFVICRKLLPKPESWGSAGSSSPFPKSRSRWRTIFNYPT